LSEYLVLILNDEKKIWDMGWDSEKSGQTYYNMQYALSYSGR
jgi:hypothetical protein